MEAWAIAEMQDEGFDASEVEIVGTPAVVDYGDFIELIIRYHYMYRDYAFSDFLLYSSDTPRVMAAEGSSVSFNFQK